MKILLKNKETLICDEFIFRCSIGKYGTTKNKVEGDKKTPSGIYNLGNLYYRKDRNKNPKTKLKCIAITKQMGWCDDPKDKKNYNKLINTRERIKHEKLYRKDHKYDYIIPILYNSKKVISNKGSAIFIHLTYDYKSTQGCVALKKNDFLIFLKLINKKTKIKIY